jgi:hypothetical protein
MRRLTWPISMRTTLLATGLTLGAASLGEVSGLQSAVFAAEDNTAATVEEATKVLDLRTLPLPDGAVPIIERQLGSASYETKADLKKAFQFQQQQLTKLGWKELPGAMNQPAYVTANFQKSGFIVSVMSYANADPAKQGTAQVFLNNFGNVRLSKLPAVKGAKSLSVNDAGTSYTTTLKPAEAAEATRKLLVEAGWEPYGATSNPPDSEVLTFKRNAVRLIAFVGVAPAQGNQTMISYSTSLMAADLPALPNAKDVEFDEMQKTLRFLTSDSFDDVAKSYKQRLTKAGWTPKTNELQKSKFGDDRTLGELAFQNGAKDSLLLQLTEQDGKTQVRLKLQTAADIAALQAALKAAQEKLAAEEKAQKEAAAVAESKSAPKSSTAKKPTAKPDDGLPDVDSLIKDAVGDALKEAGLGGKKSAKETKANADKDAVSVPIPEGAKKVTQTSGNVLQIKWPAGRGKASAEALRDQLLAAGWEANDGDKLEKTSGNVSFLKDGKQLNLTYVDAGVGEVTMMVIGIGVKLTEGQADPNAKVAAKPEKTSDTTDSKPSKATAKKKPRSADGEDAPAAGPARPEKPKRGIAKLDKLPTEAKLVADGENISLTNVVAYETISDDRWVTKIVATATPIKPATLIGLLKKGSDRELEPLSQSPRLVVELDDQDKPKGMNYAGNGSIGSAGSSGMTGEAIVEDGRARGTFKAKKESEFFGKKIIGEISFDVPVLTRDSQPAKQLANAKKLETSGNLVINDKTTKLANFVAYQVKWNDEVRTTILFSEKPINLAKLKASLAKDGTDDGFFDFASQVKVTIDKDDRPSFLNLYADGASINQNTGLVGDVIVEDGRARGTVKLDKAVDFAGKTINFDLTFDVDVLPLATKE